ncbi:aspartyl/asparaginyl beta-hydroxylase domain-containing protein [Marilutibacter aestuarii]|uniref:Aspartyl/asparaginyl beta-hydroxylase domain-containing protein n=1 Tax=Marilutibacter aestuarii TaxID=1706195 RepID=A0A508ATB3_9GAMM|nr:aspartyl/asparaginyl beta-hydroxylase domain-containing protein [Lysobacter aestuarii]TQD51744.1 aspartyl/asparaginyl beta-hydroxylase domain-containing protein [Lysobacter aestuarii]
MKLQVPFIQLPLAFDAATLAREIADLGEAPWRPHPQGFEGNSMLPLVAVDGDPANEAFAGRMQPTPALRACPYLCQVLDALAVVVGRTRLMRLAGNAEVTRHADQGYYWAERLRVHVPVVTQPTVRFECGESAVNMAAGECWVFDTWRQHRVLNDDSASRIHLVVDTVGGDGFWDLLARGRSPGHPVPPDWTAQACPPRPGHVPALACEQSNVPRVMSPWELNMLFTLLFTDTLPGPQLARVQQVSLRFVRTWRALWARHGDATEGLPAYRAALHAFLAEVGGPGQTLGLRNQLNWFAAMRAMIAQVAVEADRAAPTADADMQRMMGDNA